MRIISLLAGIFLLCSCSSSIGQVKKISMIELASIPYRTKTVIAVQPDRVYTWESVFLARVSEDDDEDYIQGRLQLARPLKDGWNCMDARVVCVLTWTNNTVDTLTFGEMYQTYNRRCYPMDSLLLRRISSYLPQRHQEEIDYYIRVDLPDAGWSEEDYARSR